jgi:hypothetical protein
MVKKLIKMDGHRSLRIKNLIVAKENKVQHFVDGLWSGSALKSIK